MGGIVTKEELEKILTEIHVWRAQEFPPHDPDSQVWDRGALAEQIAEALHKKPYPTRLQAAEAAVVEACMAWHEHQLRLPSGDRTEWLKKSDELIAVEQEACGRLHDLRAQFARVGGEVCPATYATYTCGPENNPSSVRWQTVKCTKPLGHGEVPGDTFMHEGDLGTWLWHGHDPAGVIPGEGSDYNPGT